ncbi:hypothetical protein ABTY53_06160 [Streptomyces noursei]
MAGPLPPGDLGADLRERGIGRHVIERGVGTATLAGRTAAMTP